MKTGLVLAPEYALPIDKFGTDKEEKSEHFYYERERDCKRNLARICVLLSD